MTERPEDVREQRLRGALKAFEEATTLDPNDADSWNNRAFTLDQLGDHDAALVCIERAAELAPEDDEVGRNLAEVVLWSGDAVRADELLSGITARQPDDDAAWLLLGRAKLKRGDATDAVRAFRRCVWLDSQNADYWRRLADAYATTGRTAPALEAYRRAQNLAPDDERIATGLASVLLDANREGEALALLDRFRNATLAQPYLEYNTAVALFRLGRRDQALRALRTAASGPFPSGHARDLLQEIEDARGRPGAWVEYWFGPNAGIARRACGALLFVLLLGVALTPLMRRHLVDWANTGRDWTYAVIPATVVLLLLVLPVMRRIGVGPVDIEPAYQTAIAGDVVYSAIAPKFRPLRRADDLRVADFPLQFSSE